MINKIFDYFDDTIIKLANSKDNRIDLIIFLLETTLFVVASLILKNFIYSLILLIALAMRGKRGNHNDYVLQCLINSFAVIILYVILCISINSILIALFIALAISLFTTDLTDGFFYNANHSGRKNKNEEKFIHLEEKFANDDEGLEKLKQINNEYYKQLKLFIVNELKIVDLATRFATSPRQIRRNLEYSLNILERP